MIRCDIIQDLLPLYNDDVASEGSRALIDEHIKSCPDCRDALAKMQDKGSPIHLSIDKAEIGAFKIMKKKILRRNVIVAVITGIVVLFIALNVGVKITKEYRIAYSEGLVKVSVNYADYYNSGENIAIVITDPSKNPEKTGRIAVLDVTHAQGYSVYGTGRTIVRNGEKVQVEYIYCTRNDLSKMKGGKTKSEQIFRIAHADLIGDNPVRTEVYYLTDPEVQYVDMSDEEFDNYRHKGTLIWSGVVE